MSSQSKDRRDRASALASEPAAARLAAGLECRIGRARIAVPVGAVSRIIEYQLAPLPLARPWIGGVGIHEDAPILSVALVPAQSRSARETTAKGVLLVVPDSSIGWALEIHEVFAFVRATVLPRRDEAAAGSELPRWITGARTDDGRALGWIHVPAMLADLAPTAAEAA